MNASSLWEEKKQEPSNPSELILGDAQNYTIIVTNYNAVKTEWIVIGNQKKRIRRCPTCNKILVYNSKRGYFNCKKRNGKCRSCSAVAKISRGDGTLPCRKGCKMPENSKRKIGESMKLRHQTIGHPMLGRHHSEKTIEKYKIQRVGNRNAMFGKKHTDETKQKISKTRKLRKIPGPKMSVDGLRRLRQKRITEISVDKFNGHQVMPSFNKKSCKFFDTLEKKLNWSGLYATKNGEYQIKELGYFVDYYEPTKNIVIEWDERRHYNVDRTLKLEDTIRQKEIENFLKCVFIRIDEKNFDENLILEKLKKYD